MKDMFIIFIFAVLLLTVLSVAADHLGGAGTGAQIMALVESVLVP